MAKKEKNKLRHLFKSFQELYGIYKERDNEYNYHHNKYGNTNFGNIDLKYDFKIDPVQELILKLIKEVYKEQKIYFFDCSFKLYKSTFLERNANYLAQNTDATDLDFLNSEIRYFKNPIDNRFFGEEEYYYNSFFKFSENYILSYKHKLEYLDKCFQVFNCRLILPDFFSEQNFYEKIKVEDKPKELDYKTFNQNMKSTWDYPLNSDYERFEMILNSFKTKTDIKNPKSYFRTEFLKRNDVFDSERFYKLSIEYTNKLKKALLELSENDNKLPNNSDDVQKQLYDCKHIWLNPDYKSVNLFKPKETVNLKNELKINEDNFDKIINVINSLLKNQKISTVNNKKENQTSSNFKDLVPDIKRQKYTLNVLENLSITANGRFNLSNRRKGALRGVVEALRDKNILSDLSLEKLNYAIASEIKMDLKSKLDWSKTSENYKEKALKYIIENPFK